MVKLRILTGALLAFLWSSSVALAKSPAGEVYAGKAGNVQNQLGNEAPVASGGVLPFTGLDLALIVAAGLFLVAVGLLVRRYTRTQTKSI